MLDKAFAASCKVLVIDDQELAIGYIKYPLEQLGFHEITFADRVQSAKELINTRTYDLILCAYEFRKDKDGYFLYDELKRNNVLPLQTAFIFISADTSKELIHSILELQPDDFIAKPFTIKDLDKRLYRALTRKRALKKIYRLMNAKKFNQAMDLVSKFLSVSANADFFPIALRAKGEILLGMEEAQQARDFYQAILDVQDFSWAQIGLIKALLKLNEDAEAEKLILRLALRPDAQLLAYDLLTDLQIKQKEYDMALESTVVAAEVSPRNLHRHGTAVDLSRITNDYKTQFEAAKKICKYAKNSVHDKPDIYLDAARAGIDYAMTTEDEETQSLTKEAEEFLTHFTEVSDKRDIQSQVDVCNARIFQLKDENDNAKALLKQLESDNWEGDNEEDLLDRAKALHSVGMHAESQKIIDHLAEKAAQDEGSNPLFQAFLQKEKKQKEEILLTPKELNNTAVKHYQRGDTGNAMDAFQKAFSVMPKNVSIALNLLQTLAMRAQNETLTKEDKALMRKCITISEDADLSGEQKERYMKVKTYLSDAT